MQEAEKSNVVQIRDYVHLRGRAAQANRPAATLSITQRGDAPVPPSHPPYPGGIDDLPV